MLNHRVEKFLSNPKKALFVLAMPIMIGMLVQALYNIVDTAFVGRLGAEAIAALTFAFPIFFVFIALNSGLSSGMNSRISRFLGENNIKQAENTAMHGLFLSLIIAIFVFSLGSIFIEPIFSLFGATESVLELSISYMLIVFFGVFFMFPVMILNGIFSAQGDTKTAMKIQIFALITNIILDPIFIYYLGYGVRGAAIATVIAFSLGLLLSVYFIKTKSLLHIHIKSFKYSKRILKDIFSVGFPATLMMLTMSVSMIFLNRLMAYFGTKDVASFGLVMRLDSLSVMPIVAISISLLTLVGMIYGAKRFDLLKEISKYSLKISVLISSLVGVVLFLFPELFLRIFTSDKVLLDLSSSYLRIIVFSYPLAAISLVSGRIMQGMGVGSPSLIINLIRSIFISIPLAYTLVYVFGYGYLAVPFSILIGAIVSSVVAVFWLRKKLNSVNSVSKDYN